jgi:hypothetical protein
MREEEGNDWFLERPLDTFVRSSKDQLRDTLTEKNFLCYIFFTVQHS